MAAGVSLPLPYHATHDAIIRLNDKGGAQSAVAIPSTVVRRLTIGIGQMQ